jgi:MFS family permease
MLGHVVGFRAQLSESASAFRAVFSNPNLRWLESAAVGSSIGSNAYSVAITVYAFETNGAKAVALVWVLRTVPAGLASPLLGLIADRFPRKGVMFASDLGRTVLILTAAALVWADAKPLIVYVLAGVITLVGWAFDPAQAAVLPSLANTPVELTAANVTASTINSVGFFAGPALGGALLVVADPQTVFVITAMMILSSALCVTRIRPPAEEIAAETALAETAEPVAQEAEKLLTSMLAGFRTIGGNRRLRIIVALFAATSLVLGATEVLVVSVAIDLLHIGSSGVGYLNAAFGVGALVGALIAAGFVGIRRLSIPFVCGAFLIGAPLALIASSATTALAVVCLGAVGMGNTLLDVSGYTLLQRAVPDDVLARVWGVLQMTFLAALGVGAAVAPALLAGLSIEAALVVVGIGLPILVIALGPRLIQIDAAATAPSADRLALLRRTPIFAPLPGQTLERLATQLMPLSVASGHVLIREGDHGDRFYLIADGRVEVTTEGKTVATLGPGDYVGEIALLRDIPRTATVTTVVESEFFALTREDFLAAVTSHVASRQAAETTMTSRLSGLQGVAGLSVPRL